MYHNGMIPKCFIVEETVTKNGMFEGKFLTVFRFDQAHWMRRFIEDGIVKATAQFGDNYNLETGQFGNGAKVTITYKPKDASRIQGQALEGMWGTVLSLHGVRDG